MKGKILQPVSKSLSFKMIVALLTLCVMFFSCRKSDQNVNPSKTPANSMSLADAAKINEAKDKLLAFIKDHDLTPKFNVATNEAGRNSSAKRSGKVSGNADVDYYRLLIQSAINSEDYECGPTEVDSYIVDITNDWTDEDWEVFNNFGWFVAFDIAYIYQNTDGGQFYGAKGQYTNVINRNFRDLKKFWDIPTDILIRDAHGNIFENIELVTTYFQIYGISEAEASDIANYLKTFYGDSKYNDYSHPLLTFNAFAAPADDFWGTPKKIVMGDGIMQMYDDLGYDDVAPQAVLAHEYGHHIQFANNVYFGPEPEDTRRTELMADALAAYFLTHKQGSAMNWKRVKEFLAVFYTIGDCAFDNPGHHGTPNQRMRAAQFGYDVANDTKKKGKVMKSADFISLFDSNLADIISD